MRLRFLGAHQTEAGPFRPMALLLEEAIALDAGGLTGALPLSQQNRLEAVLLTHRHYDHVRDIPLLGLNILERGHPLPIYAISDTLEHLQRSLLDGTLYLDFRRHPIFRLVPVEPLVPFFLRDHRVRAIPVPHSVPSVGWEVTTPGGATLFYTGDCGPQVSDVWGQTRPDVLVIEATLPDRLGERAAQALHLTPATLAQAVAALLRRRDAPLRVVVAHLNPAHREEVAQEAHAHLSRLGLTPTIALEGLVLEI
jgi:ribonuclease BN (tRNA processing enzyme)